MDLSYTFTLYTLPRKGRWKILRKKLRNEGRERGGDKKVREGERDGRLRKERLRTRERGSEGGLWRGRQGTRDGRTDVKEDSGM